MLNPQQVKQFWENRSNTYAKVQFESIANLEQDPENLALKIRDETAKVFDWLPDITGKNILDLGAGVGQWTFRFAERLANTITAVEYAEGLAEIGRQEAIRRQFNNIEFIVSPAECFISKGPFDIVFISGLFVYLNDNQAEQLLQNLQQMVGQKTCLLLRDGSGVQRRHEINSKFSDHLQAEYSATYRTPEEYTSLFEAAGFTCLRQENMFPEGHPLNKYPETRLRLFHFQRT